MRDPSPVKRPSPCSPNSNRHLLLDSPPTTTVNLKDISPRKRKTSYTAINPKTKRPRLLSFTKLSQEVSVPHLDLSPSPSAGPSDWRASATAWRDEQWWIAEMRRKRMLALQTSRSQQYDARRKLIRQKIHAASLALITALAGDKPSS
jgi:hypothetical protein